MEIRRLNSFFGPNLWTRSPVLEAWVDLSRSGDRTADSSTALGERLRAWLPSMFEPTAGDDRSRWAGELSGGDAELAHLWAVSTLELQRLAGTDACFSQVQAMAEPGTYKVVVGFEEEPLGRECLRAAGELLAAACQDRSFDMRATLQRLQELGNEVRFGPSTGSIVRAACARGIPIRRLNSGSLVQLGYGARQRRIRSAQTDASGAIATAIAADKDLTKSLLQNLSVPVPKGRVVTGPEDAWAAAQEIGTPVVVKPTDANHGRGVSINLKTREEVMRAYEWALPEGDGVIVEQFAVGAEHRLLVVASKMVAAARAEPEQVTGDGVHTIRQLADEVNADPLRGADWAARLEPIYLDAMAQLTLAQQGYAPDSVPPRGATVMIHYNGEHMTDVTDDVHPECAALAVLAARAVGLDIAGIDMIVPDISRPFREQGGMIVEVNAGPGLRMHLEPPFGKPRPVAEAILNTLFDEGQTGRVPIVAVTGAPGATAVSRLVAGGLEAVYGHVGLASAEDLIVGGNVLEAGPGDEAQRARAVLLHPDVEMAVLETPFPIVLREGLAFDRCDVAVVTGIGEDRWPEAGDIGSPTAEVVTMAHRLLVEVVAPQTGTAVLNAGRPNVAAMVECCRGQVIFFAETADEPVLVAHLKQGCRGVFVRGGEMILAQGAEETAIATLDWIPRRAGVGERYAAAEVLAAAGALWAIVDSPESLREWLDRLRRAGSTTVQ